MERTNIDDGRKFGKCKERQNRINILGLGEVRWKGDGDFMSDDIRIVYAGRKESQRGVAILLDAEVAKSNHGDPT